MRGNAPVGRRLAGPSGAVLEPPEAAGIVDQTPEHVGELPGIAGAKEETVFALADALGQAAGARRDHGATGRERLLNDDGRALASAGSVGPARHADQVRCGIERRECALPEVSEKDGANPALFGEPFPSPAFRTLADDPKG